MGHELRTAELQLDDRLKVLRVLTASAVYPEVPDVPCVGSILPRDIDCACANRDRRRPLGHKLFCSGRVRIVRVLKRELPRVVHCLSGTAAVAWAEALDAAALRLPLVTSLTGRDLGLLSSEGLQSRRLRCALRMAARVIVESDEAFRQVRCHDISCDKILKIPRGVSLDSIEPRGPRSPLSRALDPRFRVLFAGPLVERQGLAFLIEAVARLSRKSPGLHLTVVGAGRFLRPAKSLIAHLGIRNSVEILSRPVPCGDLLDLCSRVDVFVAPSITAKDGDREAGFPPGMLLAMAAALPVVATRHAGIPEIVEEVVTGFLAPERDVDGLVAALARARSCALRARAIGYAARSRIHRDHNARHCDAELERAYFSAAATCLPRSCLSGSVPRFNTSHIWQ